MKRHEDNSAEGQKEQTIAVVKEGKADAGFTELRCKYRMSDATCYEYARAQRQRTQGAQRP